MNFANTLRSLLALCAFAISLQSQQKTEDDYFALQTCIIPDEVVVEVGGLLPRPDGSLLIATRRGAIWSVAAPWSNSPTWTLWADGLQEPLGLLAGEQGSVLCGQRGEVTRIRDRDGDGRADDYEVVCDGWNISGAYHEYAFGPRRDPDGNLWMTLNKSFGDEWFGAVDWRGFAMRIDRAGEATPVCAGLRSPAGLEVAPWGDVFYTDNQGEWCNASKLAQLIPGSFQGHPQHLESARLPRSRVEHPGAPPDGLTFPEAAAQMENLQLPAVWFPFDKTGRSPSGMCWDQTEGAFGPFAGQLFVGDQYGANILRVDLEKVDGHWQGSCFRFREGLASGVIRVAFDRPKLGQPGLIIGMSDRGWPSLGSASFGVQRLHWTGETPFEIKSVRLTPRGFRLTMTAPIDPESIHDAFRVESYTYRYQEKYGSPEVDRATLPIEAVRTDGTAPQTVELDLGNRRRGYVHEIKATGLRDQAGRSLLHDTAWYTLIRFLPETERDH